jgi:head-tail adaptor
MSVLESLLNADYIVFRQQRQSDGQGGWLMSYAELGAVRGRLRPVSSRERETAALEQRQISHVFYCLAGTDIARGDMIEGNGLVVVVQGVREPSQAGHHYEVDCLELQVETAEGIGS